MTDTVPSFVTATDTSVGEPFCTSGTSPTTIHLVGPGQVGQAFLRLLPDTAFRLVGITDTSATLHARDGLDPTALAELKARHSRLRDVPNAESLPVDLAIDLVDADIVVDATPTGLDGAVAVRRNLRVLNRGKRIALASKDALCLAAQDLLAQRNRDRVGFHAALGGTGAALQSELRELRRECREIIIVGNASTTAVIETVERGGSIEDGIRRAQEKGVLEPDPELDLSGADAATKLIAVVRALWQRDVCVDDVRREHLTGLAVDTLRRRFQAGSTTRLVARARPGGALQVSYEAVSRSSVLAVPPTHVVYTYELSSGESRVHVGHGIGPRHTAEALLHDVRVLSARLQQGSARRVS
jgi:homoserine dehydrogenase